MGRGHQQNNQVLDSRQVIFSSSFNRQRKRAEEVLEIENKRNKLRALYKKELHREPSLINEKGARIWWDDNDQPHRDGDLPAVEHANGKKEWWQHGVRHRDFGPAIESPNQLHQVWYQNGVINSVNDQPAITGLGSQEWMKDGLHHRSNDLPAIIMEDGTREWWQNGKRHRENGPAIESADGSKEFWLNDQQVEG